MTVRYCYVFKKKAVKLYQQDQWIDTPEGLNRHDFHCTVRRWVRLVKHNGFSVLDPNRKRVYRTAEEKLKIVLKVLQGSSPLSIHCETGINHSTITDWVQAYKLHGYNGLMSRKNKKKFNALSKPCASGELNESEREELLRLREENEYLRTDLAVTKNS